MMTFVDLKAVFNLMDKGELIEAMNRGDQR